jgi:hypothetical protein
MKTRVTGALRKFDSSSSARSSANNRRFIIRHRLGRLIASDAATFFLSRNQPFENVPMYLQFPQNFCWQVRLAQALRKERLALPARVFNMPTGRWPVRAA